MQICNTDTQICKIPRLLGEYSKNHVWQSGRMLVVVMTAGLVSFCSCSVGADMSSTYVYIYQS